MTFPDITNRDYITIIGMAFLALLFDLWAATMFGLGAMFYRMGQELDDEMYDDDL